MGTINTFTFVMNLDLLEVTMLLQHQYVLTYIYIYVCVCVYIYIRQSWSHLSSALYGSQDLYMLPFFYNSWENHFLMSLFTCCHSLDVGNLYIYQSGKENTHHTKRKESKTVTKKKERLPPIVMTEWSLKLGSFGYFLFFFS